MKILNAIHAQTIGGVDQVFVNYAEALTATGHEVALLISDNGNDNYKISGLKQIFKLKNRSQALDVLHLLFILLKFRPDFIICHSNRLMKWMKFFRFLKVKSIAVNHGITFKHSLNCDFVISINEQIAAMVEAKGKKSFVLHNVIKITEKYKTKAIAKPLKIGIYGRIEPRKGFDILLKAAAILAKENFEFRLKIGGFEVPGGYNWQWLQEFAKTCGVFEKCEFVGVVKDKKEFFKDVDIFVVPSREEPFGLVILEGFLFSTLVISSNTDGGKLLVEDDYLFMNGDEFDLAKKIKIASESDEKYQANTARDFEKLEKDFSFDYLKEGLNAILFKCKKNSSH